MELQALDTQKGEQALSTTTFSRQLCEVVGAGRWNVRIWRVVSSDRRVGYRMSLFLEGRKKRRSRSCDFTVSDVADLPRLARVIAQSLVNDGWLRREVKDDLACLAHALDLVLGEAKAE